MGGVCAPPSHRQRLWESLPLGPVARAAVVQAVLAACVLWHTDPDSHGRAACYGMTALGMLTLPIGRLASHLSRDHPSVYYWSARVWAAAVPAVFTLTIGDAFDGSGLPFAERMCAPPFGIAAAVGVCFCIGAQGALLSVPRDLALNVAAIMVAMCTFKMRMAYSPAYLTLHLFPLGAIGLGYFCVAKYADVHEAMREAAEAVVVGAAAREPFVVTDHVLHIRAVNQRLLDVLGYEEDELVGRPVMELLDEASSWGGDHAWIRRTLFESAARKENPNGHVWSVLTKAGQAHPVRITLGETRCPVSAMRMFTAQFTCMRLEHRNAQLQCEKEKLQWEVASHHDGEEDPRERLGATVPDCGHEHCEGRCQATHRTLGVMQDQATTDEAVSVAHSFDHVASSIESPTVPGHTLIVSARPKTPSSIESLQSSVMDTVSQAAKKSPTRAPPPPKHVSRLPRPTTVRSEPASSMLKPKAGTKKNTPPKRAVPGVEKDPRECS